MKRIAWIALGWFALLASAQADQPTDQERQKAHLVSRIYQATYGAQERCSSHKDELTRLNKAIAQFRQTFPELMRLVDSSPYLPQAREQFKALWNNPGEQFSIGDCRETANMLRQWFEHPEGQEGVNDMIQTLGGNSQLQSTKKNSGQAASENLGGVVDTQPHKPPFFVPFEAQKAGSILTTELRVVEHRSYVFALLWKAKKGTTMEDAKRLIELAGRSGRDKNGKLVWPGISTPLKLKVSAIDTSGERIIYDKEIHEEEVLGVGWSGIEKLIDSIELRPGRYRINIQSLKDIPELVENPITFGIYGWPNTNPID